MRHTVVITDGEQRAALALTRAYGRAGHAVIVCGHRRDAIAKASRYCTAARLVPDPLRFPDDFLSGIERISRETGADTLIPVADSSLLAVLGAKDRLSHVVVPFPPLADFKRISDKGLLLSTAPQVGIRVPTQVVLSTREALSNLEVPELPIVLKPVRSVAQDGVGGGLKVGVSYARDAAELDRRLGDYPAAAYPILLQQRVVGSGVGIFLLVWDGELRAVFAHRRLREKPPSGGVSVYCESIAPPAELVARSRALLDRFAWRGVAMVEYKMEARTGTPYLMEINGRFWGSLQLAIDAGVDFPNLLLALSHGQSPAPITEYRIGVRNRWWWGDVDHLLARFMKSDEELALPPDRITRWRALGQFLRRRRGDHNEILRSDDPKPFLRETLNWVRGR